MLDKLVELFRRLLDAPITPSYFLVGGCSPVATHQILEASRLATIVDAAPNPAYRPVQSTFRNTHTELPQRSLSKRLRVPPTGSAAIVSFGDAHPG